MFYILHRIRPTTIHHNQVTKETACPELANLIGRDCYVTGSRAFGHSRFNFEGSFACTNEPEGGKIGAVTNWIIGCGVSWVAEWMN